MKVGERADAELTGDTLEEARSFLGLLQSSRCIGRLPWKTLIVRDCREMVTPEEIFGGCVDHLRLATKGGRIRPVMSVFAADRDQLHAMTTPAVGIWVRASCRPGSVRCEPGRFPAGCGPAAPKHHAGNPPA